jgi:hypothetical protein
MLLERVTFFMATLNDLLSKQKTRVQAVVNILLESPYFYRTDHDELFLFLARYQREFTAFFESFFGWQLIMDAKCARLYKELWYNTAITPGNRDLFNFTKRDDCLAFMLLLEFFEQKLEEDSASVDEPENIKFRFGDLLIFERNRFSELFPDKNGEYSEEQIRRVLRTVMPQLERYRFLRKLDPPADQVIEPDDTIYECLPALWHYSVQRISRPLSENDRPLEAVESSDADERAARQDREPSEPA